MRTFLARIAAAFRRRPRPVPPRTHVVVQRDDMGRPSAWWRTLSADEIAQHRRDREAEFRPRRWLDRRR